MVHDVETFKSLVRNSNLVNVSHLQFIYEAKLAFRLISFHRKPSAPAERNLTRRILPFERCVLKME